MGKRDHAADAETTPLRNPEEYRFDLNLRDIAEVWRRGSVVSSWLLDLTATASAEGSHTLDVRGAGVGFRRGTLDHQGCHRRSVPAPVLSAALYSRFSSRGEAEFADKLLSAMRLRVRRTRGEAGTQVTIRQSFIRSSGVRS